MTQVGWMLVVTYLSFRPDAVPTMTVQEVYKDRKECLTNANKIQHNIKAGDGRAACLKYNHTRK